MEETNLRENKKMEINFLLIIFLGLVILSIIFIIPGITAQSLKRQTIASYGTIGKADDVRFSQTAGQSFNTSTESSGISKVTQGFLQPISFTVSEIQTPTLNNLNITVFPNPATYSVTINSDKNMEHSLIQVVDMNGRNILSKTVDDLQFYKMNCDKWLNGVYIISISDSMNNKKTFRLIISK